MRRMRTTVQLDPDIVRAVEHLRRAAGMGVSEAVNTLARRGLAARESEPQPFTQSTSPMGRPRIPLDDIGAALEILEGDTHR